MIKRLCILIAVTSALASPVWANSFNMGVLSSVIPFASQTVGYDVNGLTDTFSFKIASGDSVIVGFQDFPKEGSSLPMMSFQVKRTSDLVELGSWGTGAGFNGFVSKTVTGLSVGEDYFVSVYAGLSLSPGTAGHYDLTLSIPTAPVPEPETYAMLMAGLGMLGFVARRRKVRQTS